MFREITNENPLQKGEEYVSIYKAWPGWQTQLLSYNEETDSYEPWHTGLGPYRSFDKAKNDAISWAHAEDVAYTLVPE